MIVKHRSRIALILIVNNGLKWDYNKPALLYLTIHRCPGVTALQSSEGVSHDALHQIFIDCKGEAAIESKFTFTMTKGAFLKYIIKLHSIKNRFATVARVSNN